MWIRLSISPINIIHRAAIGAELSHTGAELSRDNSAWAELSWAELSVGRVVCHSYRHIQQIKNYDINKHIKNN